jgi:urease gamma subunit
MRRKLFFIRYPIERHKAAIQELVDKWNAKYDDFTKALSENRNELETAVAAFYERHSLKRDMPDLSPEMLRERFRVSQQMIPLSLRGDIVSDVFTSEEMRRIKEQAKQQVMEKYREDMNTATGDFFASVKNAMQRLNKGKMITRATLAKMHRLYNDALEGLAVTQDERYTGTFEVMENMVETLANRRQQHGVTKQDKEAASSIISETLEVTRAISTRAKPTLEEFEAILTADKHPTKKRHEGIREVIEGLTLPTASTTATTEEQKSNPQ